MSEEEVKEAIRTILDDKPSYQTSLNYAIGYCETGLKMTGRELRIQTLYILNNIIRWRHPKAQEVRTTLREFTN